jgi:hypothetical protein
MSRPLTQHDDVLREMTEEEYAQYLQTVANTPPVDSTDETSSPA